MPVQPERQIGLLNLPKELLSLIIGKLERHDLAKSISVCKHFSSVALETLYKHVSLRVGYAAHTLRAVGLRLSPANIKLLKNCTKSISISPWESGNSIVKAGKLESLREIFRCCDPTRVEFIEVRFKHAKGDRLWFALLAAFEQSGIACRQFAIEGGTWFGVNTIVTSIHHRLQGFHWYTIDLPEHDPMYTSASGDLYKSMTSLRRLYLVIPDGGLDGIGFWGQPVFSSMLQHLAPRLEDLKLVHGYSRHYKAGLNPAEDLTFPALRHFECSNLPPEMYKSIISSSPRLISLSVGLQGHPEGGLLANIPPHIEIEKLALLALDPRYD